MSTVAAMAAHAYRHADAIGFDAFQVPAMLLEAWVAERRNDGDAATDAYRRALELAGGAGFVDHVAFALSGLASCALARGDVRQAEELQRRALATAEASAVGLDRRPRARPARPHPGRRRRHRHRRGAVPRRARVVRQTTAARSSREPVPGARGRPGRGRPGRPRRPRAGSPRDCGRDARRECSDAVARIRGGEFLRPPPRVAARAWSVAGRWQSPTRRLSLSSSDTTGGTRGDKDD